MVTLEKTVRTLIRGLASGGGPGVAIFDTNGGMTNTVKGSINSKSPISQKNQVIDLYHQKHVLDSMNFTESGRNTIGDLKEHSLSQLDSSLRQNRNKISLQIPELRNLNDGRNFQEGIFKKKRSSTQKSELATFGKRSVAHPSSRDNINIPVHSISGFNEVVREMDIRQVDQYGNVSQVMPSSDRPQYEQKTLIRNFSISLQ